MLYLLAGKLMSLITYFVFYKLFTSFIDLSLLNRSVGWFFIEHVFEEYSMTSGKFFLTTIDFRTLIKNFLIIVRNILVWSHFWTLLEFILAMSVLILLLFVLFYFFKANTIKKKKIEVAILFYYISVIYAVLLRAFVLFNLFDIYFIFKPIFVFFVFFFLIRYMRKKIADFYLNILNKKNTICLAVVAIKVVFYIICVLTMILIFIKILLTINIVSNNVSQEFLIKVLLLYIYLYYICMF